MLNLIIMDHQIYSLFTQIILFSSNLIQIYSTNFHINRETKYEMYYE
jgi:hypothetical protein